MAATDRADPRQTLTRREATVALAGAAAVAGLGCTPSPTGKGGAQGGPATEAKGGGDGAETSSGARMPTAFIPHGGGPWPIMPLPMMPAGETDSLAAYMRSIGQVPAVKPRALLVLSAHWEAEKVTINTGAKPDLYFDYYGFPPGAYELKWPAPGDPELAGQVEDLLKAGGFATGRDADRGFDHGTFIPLILAYPQADVPVVQVSLKKGLDPDEHFALGRALAPLRERGVYILGSGNSFHNLRAVMKGDRSFVPLSVEFDDWLAEAVTLPANEREGRLRAWQQAPAARQCHPREEHLIPLMAVAGVAGDDAGSVAWSGSMAGMKVSAHHFG